jgi:excisionase family DNA binding protein
VAEGLRRDTVAVWSGRTMALPGGCMLIGPADVANVRALVSAVEKYVMHPNGQPLSPSLARLRAIASTAEADVSTNGLLDVQHETASASWPHDEIPLTEAAEMLGVGRRHANRLAHAGLLGPTRKVSGRWLVSRTDVATYLADKEE